ncbi:MAG: TMEM43 family protein [Candidatus Bathyarchaeota archaeon]|nr:TMEM43 family protein [Candidatus Bathyarchaeota archaeon]
MSSRVKVFGLIALIGFIAGVLAQVTATFVIPWLVEVLPLLGGITSYLVAGFAGAILTVVIVGAWAYMTGRRNQPY